MDSRAPSEMHLYSTRLATFHTTHQLNKRRKSSSTTRKKKDAAAEWPHKTPTPEQLARAGFFYRPGQDSLDNVQCFFCNVKLDGWEATDDPVREHLAHSDWCAWATARSVERDDEQEISNPEERDPMSESLLTARQATFTYGNSWPHEAKKGWKCKVVKMVEAGWAWDPTADGGEPDGVTCFYCNLSLDGWEPKDDPYAEHQRRTPDCSFFKLMERFHGQSEASGKAKKTKSKRKAGASSSTAGRVSFQSVISDAPTAAESFTDVHMDSSMAGVDDSIATTATAVSQATTTGAGRGKNKSSKSKAASKGASSKTKAAGRSGAGSEATLDYPELGEMQGRASPEPAAVQDAEPEEQVNKPTTKSKKKATRQSKQTDPAVEESEAGPPKKTTRGRKPKTKEDLSLGDEGPLDRQAAEPRHATARTSNASVQLLEELEQSIDNFSEVPAVEQSTPPIARARSKQGIKRTSDGTEKQQSPPTAVESVAPATTQDHNAPKPKKGRKQKAPSAAVIDQAGEKASSSAQPDDGAVKTVSQMLSRPSEQLESEAPIVTKKGKARTQAKKASAPDTSRSSKATIQHSNYDIFVDEPEDLERDEMEIDAELARIEAEQIQKDASKDSQRSKVKSNLQPLDNAVRQESRTQGHVQAEPEINSPARPSANGQIGGNTPSPCGSDKENQPSSIMQPSAKVSQPQVILSPTKFTRVPLAPDTPNRSPSRLQSSPNRQISHLSSAAPWTAIDLDTVLLKSPQPTPGRLGQELVAAAGDLTSPEKRMSIEEWVSYRALKGEEDMKRRGEEMVAVFEREGMRGLQSLAGIRARS